MRGPALFQKHVFGLETPAPGRVESIDSGLSFRAVSGESPPGPKEGRKTSRVDTGTGPFMRTPQNLRTELLGA